MANASGAGGDDHYHFSPQIHFAPGSRLSAAELRDHADTLVSILQDQHKRGTSGNPSQFGAGLTALAQGTSLVLPVQSFPSLTSTPLLLTWTAGGNITGGSVRFALHFLSFGAPLA